jgi:non-ribosomal peptide synthetase component F
LKLPKNHSPAYQIRTTLTGPSTIIMAATFETHGSQQKTPHLAETSLEEWRICIHQIIEQQALSYPEKEAICSEEGTLSYRELNDLASCLARHLTTLGIGPEILVPLFFDKSMWNVVSMLAVLKSGGAFVPLDPAAPVARLQTLVRNVGATVVLCSQQHAILLGSVANKIIPIDGEVIRQLPESSGDDNESRVEPNNLAYCEYSFYFMLIVVFWFSGGLYSWSTSHKSFHPLLFQISPLVVQ